MRLVRLLQQGVFRQQCFLSIFNRCFILYFFQEDRNNCVVCHGEFIMGSPVKIFMENDFMVPRHMTCGDTIRGQGNIATRCYQIGFARVSHGLMLTSYLFREASGLFYHLFLLVMKIGLVRRVQPTRLKKNKRLVRSPGHLCNCCIIAIYKTCNFCRSIMCHFSRHRILPQIDNIFKRGAIFNIHIIRQLIRGIMYYGTNTIFVPYHCFCPRVFRCSLVVLVAVRRVSPNLAQQVITILATKTTIRIGCRVRIMFFHRFANGVGLCGSQVFIVILNCMYTIFIQRGISMPRKCSSTIGSRDFGVFGVLFNSMVIAMTFGGLYNFFFPRGGHRFVWNIGFHPTIIHSTLCNGAPIRTRGKTRPNLLRRPASRISTTGLCTIITTIYRMTILTSSRRLKIISFAPCFQLLATKQGAGRRDHERCGTGWPFRGATPVIGYFCRSVSRWSVFLLLG